MLHADCQAGAFLRGAYGPDHVSSGIFIVDANNQQSIIGIEKSWAFFNLIHKLFY